MTSLTVIEASLIDLQKQRAAHDMRAKNFNPGGSPPGEAPEVGDISLPADHVDALTRPVRIEIDFRHPIHTRKQLNALAAFIVEAQVLTQQHDLGIGRQRMRLWAVMKDASDMLAMINGKTPAGRRGQKLEVFHKKMDGQD
ncbi:hypothetical protein UFOVP1339_14 [uncultured Caudovirales phage]|uniref:Uncharacterized protein n=1 Tax=uncultured Caudovirales phage TaxID=2100421 RepID=A0A6J5RZ68_9CAUD|nr:hypothetical protein UFOVP1339_14 [uncultured Caudovirales phage]